MLKAFFSREFVTFIIIGIINTVSTTIFASLLNMTGVFSGELCEKFNVTFIIGYILGLCLSFFLNCRFTFHEKPTLGKAVRFPISYIPNFLIQYLFVWLFTMASLPKTLAYLAAAAVGVPLTFLVMKFFIFTNNTH